MKQLHYGIPYIFSLQELKSGFCIKVLEHIVLTHDDLKAVNTEENPGNVAPSASNATKMENGQLTSVLGKHSWNVIRLKK